MVKKDKRQRFERVFQSRSQKVLNMIQLLGNCANKANYAYDQEEAQAVLGEIQQSLDKTRGKFTSNSPYDTHMKEFQSFFEKDYTWINGFRRNVNRFADRTALFFPQTGESWTYAQLDKETNKFANAMLAQGVGHHDIVMCQLQNCPVFVFAYVAAQKIGAVCCPINFRLSAGEIAHTMEDSRPPVFVYEADMQEEVDKAMHMTTHRPETAIMMDISGEFTAPEGYVKYEDFVKDFSDAEPELDFAPTIYDETTRMYTSGTTGRQKGVPLTSINEVLSSHDVMIHFPLSFQDKTMNTTPWFHRGGLHSGGPAPTLYAGGTVVILRKFDARICLQMVEQHQITFLIGVPTVLERLAEEQERSGRDLSSLKGIVTMGSPLERAACIRYQKLLTPNIFNGYGTTETFWNTFLRPFDLPEMAGSAGTSCADDEVRVVKIYDDHDAATDDLARTDNMEVGEVIIKSSAKSAYFYINNEEETASKFHDGYMYTKDLATWDKNHYITIVGRKDDMIISSGENIYPTQVEEVLNAHPKVADCIVTAVPDKARGELVTAYIIPADSSLTVEELERYCVESPMIANYKRPRYYRFTENIPCTETGKKLHYKMKAIAKDDLLNGLLVRP